MSQRVKADDGRIWLFDKVLIEQRGDYWHFRMWLDGESKYVRESLKTRDLETAKKRAEERYIQLRADQKSGKRYFSITAEEGVNLYLADKQKLVELKTITKGRHGTISTHLGHWLNYIKRETKLKELERNAAEGYFAYRIKNAKHGIAHTTLANEQGTINAMMAYLFRAKQSVVEAFDFPKLSKYEIDNEAIRRATLTNDEYNALTKAMRSYVARKANKLDDDEHMMRELARHYVLIAANAGLRTGEQQQLRWCDVKMKKHELGAAMQTKLLAEIYVRKETSKVRKDRKLYCRGGTYFERWKELSNHTSSTDLIFSLDGKTRISNRAILYHFHRMVKLAGIVDHEARGIVPYSLRHFMITQRVLSGLSFQQVAEMCGTSDTEIRKTYYHLIDDRRLANAVADFRRDKDGRIIPI
jgi:site-specific recombinase XerD